MKISGNYLYLIIFLAIFIFGAGIFFGKTISNNYQDTDSERLNSQKYKFINPLLDMKENPKRPLLNSELAVLRNKIENLTDEYIDSNLISRGSVYYRDLNNGPWLMVGDEYNYKAASLFKVPLMIAFFKLAEINPDILKKEVVYTTPFQNVPNHQIPGSFITIELGKTYTIEQLIEQMIIYSDNYAAYLLLENISSELVLNVFNDFDVPLITESTIDKTLSPRTYASFLRILYNSTYLNEYYSEKALEILSRTKYTNGMRQVLPSDIPASIKYGVTVVSNGERQLHECGIIYWTESSPYILCVMTAGFDFDAEAKYTQDVTRLILESLNSN